MTWNAYGVAVHQQRALWTVPIASHIWTFAAVHYRIFGALGNDNGRPLACDQARVIR